MMARRFVQSGRFWALFPAILLTSLVTTVLLLVRTALSDPAMAVDDGYYDKALAWDARRTAERQSAQLGFRADANLTRFARNDSAIAVTIVDRTGAPVRGASVTVDAFAIVRSNQVVHATLHEEPDGIYRARLPMNRLGLWELSLTAQRGDERFVTVLRRDLLERPAS